MNGSPAPIDHLLSDLVDGDLSLEAGSRLAALVHRDPDARQRYLLWCELHALLQWEHGVLGTMSPRTAAPVVERRRPTRWLGMAVAAMLMLGVALGAWWLAGPDAPAITTPTASITALHECRWNHAGPAPEPGTLLAEGRILDLAAGRIGLSFTCGATMTVAGPARLVLRSPWAVHLEHGVARIHVPPQAIGFRVSTAQVDVIDLGTSFGLDVATDRSAVVVLSGSVRAIGQVDAAELVLRRDEGRTYRADGDEAVADLPALRARIEALTLPTHPLSPTTMLRWSFDAATDDIARSLIATGHAADAITGRWVGDRTRLPEVVDGRFAGALRFSGANHVVLTVPGVGELRARTIACWVRMPADASLLAGGTFIGWDRRDHIQGMPNAGRMGWNQDPTHGPIGALRCTLGRTVLVGGTSLRDGTWHHVALVMAPDARTGSLLMSQYVDGRLDGTLQKPPATRAPRADALGSRYSRDELLVGCDPEVTAPPRFHGDLDELVVFDRILTAEEILDLSQTNR